MKWSDEDILYVLDKCSENLMFPMLDNGYVYLAATRLSLYRSAEDWAIVIEVFGFSPRSGIPDTCIHTFGSRLVRKKTLEDYMSRQAFDAYLGDHSHNEAEFIFPIEEGNWQDSEDAELLACGQHSVVVRGNAMPMPGMAEYSASGITLSASPNIFVFEFCRFLAGFLRDQVLTTIEERRMCVPSELKQVMQLEEWNHPDIVCGELISVNSTFQSLAEVLASGQVDKYIPSSNSNTHWKNWPDGGSL